MRTVNEIIRSAGNLPAANIADRLNEELESNSCIVVTAPPGAGKSTLLPLTISAGNIAEGKIIMLEPRRLAAIQIAERMADIMGEPTGKNVGYRVRFDNKTGKDTQIEVVTEGILTRMTIADPTLDGVSVVIFDEFHERSLNTDLALSLVRQAQQLLRPDLKIVIMSATINTNEICKCLQAPLIESKGRMFPVTVRYAGEEISDINATVRTDDVAHAVAMAIAKAHRNDEGDILAFLPGQAEIKTCAEILGSSLGETKVFPLYGNLSTELQRKAIAPSKEGERKVVLATPIAETSVTIEGVKIVIDSGLCKSLVFNPRTGLSHLMTTRISMDMATQRTGRAGRTSEGVCYRLWNKASESRMKEQREPEILYADLAPMTLSVYAFGESDIESLPWITLPPKCSIAMAKELLLSLDATNDNGNITPLGKKMAALPCHPRIGRMILSAKNEKMKCLACDIAALLEEKDPMIERNDTDISIRVSTLRRLRRENRLGKWMRIAQIAKDYMRMAKVKEDNSDPVPDDLGELIAHAYPERIAMSTDSIGSFRMANGKNVRIDAADSMAANEWIAVAAMNSNETGGAGRVFLAAPLDKNCLDSSLTKTVENIAWSHSEGSIVARREKRVGKLVVEAKQIQDTDNDTIKHVICEAVKKDGMSMLSWSDDRVITIQQRIATVAMWHPELELPDLSTERLQDCAEKWLPLYLEKDGHVLKSVQELRKLNLAEILWNTVPYDMQMEVERLAPTHIQMPTGSRIRLDYRQGTEVPVLSVRLQECFGMKDTPCVDGGKRKVLMELLSPGFKPVQLTQDLCSFWQTTYFDVRKEMRRRYPKHYWPDNPLEAEAVRGVKRMNSSQK